MILIQCDQGTPEWHQARAGVITASKFADAVLTTAKGLRTAKSILYSAQVAVEIISGEPSDDVFNSWQMRRGSELEPAARMEYETLTGNFAAESGVVLTDDRKFGYSTDGFVGDDGLIEIKCLASAEKIIAMWRTGDMSDYMHQMQGGMWITGRKWCDFVMYCPQLEKAGKQIFYRRVPRDEAFIEKLEKDLVEFDKYVQDDVLALVGETA